MAIKLGVLFSGGKDSCLAMHKASQYHDITCLLSVKSKNPESYMFHTPNISLVELQAKAIKIPIIIQETEGEKEKELKELKKLIEKGIKEYEIKGIVTGALASIYQAERVQKICSELGVWCFNPLWQMDQEELLNELLDEKFTTIIAGVFGYPLDETYLGKEIDENRVYKLVNMAKEYKINPAGEGGEIETFVIDGPMFKKRIKITESKIEYKNHAGVFEIKKAELTQSNPSAKVSM